MITIQIIVIVIDDWILILDHVGNEQIQNIMNSKPIGMEFIKLFMQIKWLYIGIEHT